MWVLEAWAVSGGKQWKRRCCSRRAQSDFARDVRCLDVRWSQHCCAISTACISLGLTVLGGDQFQLICIS